MSSCKQSRNLLHNFVETKVRPGLRDFLHVGERDSLHGVCGANKEAKSPFSSTCASSKWRNLVARFREWESPGEKNVFGSRRIRWLIKWTYLWFSKHMLATRVDVRLKREMELLQFLRWNLIGSQKVSLMNRKLTFFIFRFFIAGDVSVRWDKEATRFLGDFSFQRHVLRLRRWSAKTKKVVLVARF